jgi:mono/diheme cytochrome c family protein
MRSRLSKLVLTALAITVLLSLLTAASAAEDTQTLDLTVATGDPEAGREAFLALMCTSCHAVAGEDDFPAPKVKGPVPVLGPDQAKLKPGKIATSIVSPSHKISKEVSRGMEGDLSPMGDFSEAMTVRQLIDLVAYVQSLGG